MPVIVALLGVQVEKTRFEMTREKLIESLEPAVTGLTELR